MVSAKTPREWELAREELTFCADKHKVSNDSHIHVSWCGDDVQVLLPRETHAEHNWDLQDDMPIKYTPFSTTVQAIFDIGIKNQISYKQSKGHRKHMILNSVIANSMTSTSTNSTSSTSTNPTSSTSTTTTTSSPSTKNTTTSLSTNTTSSSSTNNSSSYSNYNKSPPSGGAPSGVYESPPSGGQNCCHGNWH